MPANFYVIFFRFVLYQLSKNLNRPFFMDFLTQLSIRYTEKSAVVDEEDPDDQGEKIKCVCFWTRLELETKVNSLLPRIDFFYLGCHKTYFWVGRG